MRRYDIWVKIQKCWNLFLLNIFLLINLNHSSSVEVGATNQVGIQKKYNGGMYVDIKNMHWLS